MKTLQELKDIRAAKCGQIDIRFNPDTAEEAVKTYVLVCGGTGCQSNHSVEVMDELKKLIEAAGKKDEIQIIQTSRKVFLTASHPPVSAFGIQRIPAFFSQSSRTVNLAISSSFCIRSSVSASVSSF